jgi:drug/metabolite transporter (DMT)-like permease
VVSGPGHDAPGHVDRAALARTWLGATMISFSAVFVRLADTEAFRSALLRAVYALPAFALLLWWQRRRAGRGLGGALVPLAVVAGMALGLDLATWHVSIGLIGAGLGTVLPNLQVVFVGLAGVSLFGERPRAGFWVALPVVLAGVWLLGAVGEPVTASGSVVAGVLLGVLTAAFYSVFLVVVRVARLRRPRATSVEVMASATLGAALVLLVTAAPQGLAGPAQTLAGNLWLVALALGSQVVGWLLLSSSIHRLPAALTSVALLLQPVLALVWGAVFLAEPVGAPQVLGAAVVLAGVAVAHRAIVTALVPATADAT